MELLIQRARTLNSLQNYKNTTPDTCTIITKGGKFVARNLAHHVNESRRWRGRELVALLNQQICVETPKLS